MCKELKKVETVVGTPDGAEVVTYDHSVLHRVQDVMKTLKVSKVTPEVHDVVVGEILEEKLGITQYTLFNDVVRSDIYAPDEDIVYKEAQRLRYLVDTEQVVTVADYSYCLEELIEIIEKVKETDSIILEYAHIIESEDSSYYHEILRVIDALESLDDDSFEKLHLAVKELGYDVVDVFNHIDECYIHASLEEYAENLYWSLGVLDDVRGDNTLVLVLKDNINWEGVGRDLCLHNCDLNELDDGRVLEICF